MVNFITDEGGNKKLCERCKAGNWAKNTIDNLDVCLKCFNILDRIVNKKPKKCCKCKKIRIIDDYTKDKQTSDGLASRCSECRHLEDVKYYQDNYEKIRKDAKEWRTKNPGKRLERERLSRYKLSPQAFNKLLEKQNNLCKICNKQFEKNLKPRVDHDHSCCPGQMTCGKCVRGLLCINCNLAIGLLEDSISYMENAISYVKGNK